ncbi:MAG TPA: FISUMP domain-containing protein [Saprospiraceae bacterium]|nr:FISUMP domain-containing protein [Saprospiraceae bacterium]HQW26006.1 FISUMP domain-containing protein [Saprospiraceae bacterium]
MVNKISLVLLLIAFATTLTAQNIGIGIPAPLGKLHIKGASDVSQLIIDAHTTQNNTSPLLKFRSSSGNDLLWMHTDTSLNTFIGIFAGRVNNAMGGGLFNTYAGSHAGFSSTTGNSNSGFGANSLFLNTTGSFNSANGLNALFFNGSGSWNTAIGANALFSNTIGSNNTAVGNAALLSNNNGSSNTASGTDAMKQNVSGNNNIGTGYKALLNNTTGSNNTSVGNETLNTTTIGSNNTAIGYKANVAADDIVNATAIGSNAYAGASNSVVIGSINGINGATANSNVGIGTTTPNAKLHVSGAVKISDGTQGAGKILTSDATGLASWQPPPPPPAEYYQTVWICCNPWMTKNLDVDTYRNGDAIPKVTDPSAWAALTTGAYCYYNNDSINYAAVYGKLYNGYAINDPRGLAPEGWHVPTDLEWTTFENCLGGSSLAAGPMKEIGTSHWNSPNTDATDLSGFKALPGGIRWDTGVFSSIQSDGHWWSSTNKSSVELWFRNAHYNSSILDRYYLNMRFGFSIRCIRD